MKRLPSDVEARLQFHVKLEEKSVRFYSTMGHWLNYNGYFETSKIYMGYAAEEFQHLAKVKKYLLDRDVLPDTPAQEEIKPTYTNLKEVLLAAQKFTVNVSDEYNTTAQTCLKSGCMPTFTFVQWFVNDQIHEESKAQGFIDRITALEACGAPLSDFESYAHEFNEGEV